MTEQTTACNLMYLPKDYWSPRYESNFYTVKIESYRLITSFGSSSSTNSENPEQEPIIVIPSSTVVGNTNLPAYYYEVVVYRENQKKSIFRRYSQFKWLHEQIITHPPVPPPVPHHGEQQGTSTNHAGPIRLPPGTCLFSIQTEEFAQNRSQQLSEYISDVLSRPGYANHQAVIAFLEL